MPIQKRNSSSNAVSTPTESVSQKTQQESRMYVTPSWIGRLVILVVLVSLIVGGISGAFFASSGLLQDLGSSIGSALSIQKSATNVSTKTVSVLEDSQTVDVVEKANEAVVSIIITKDLSKFYNSTGPSTPFDFFFNTQPPTSGKQQVGGGSGFIIGSDGLIVTNKHVISDTDAEYTVLLNNRESYTAKVIATDPLNDVAFLKIEAEKELPTLELGDSEALQIGQTVIAIGNALGEYRNTVTKGIVSGLARTVVAGDGQGSQETLDNVIQTDAAINPGNSGGPLLNIEGQVIGVNTAINSEGQLIGFAIPVNEIKKAVESVKESGRIVRPMLGVRYVMLTEDIAKQKEIAQTSGALLVSGSSVSEPAVIPDSPADRAGLQEDDIIIDIGGKTLNAEDTLSRIIQEYAPGDQVTITYLREGSEAKATVKLDELNQ